MLTSSSSCFCHSSLLLEDAPVAYPWGKIGCGNRKVWHAQRGNNLSPCDGLIEVSNFEGTLRDQETSPKRPIDSLFASLKREPVYSLLSHSKVTYHSHASLTFIQFTHSSQALADSFLAPLSGTYILLHAWG